MIRRPPRSTLFPTRRSSDLNCSQCRRRQFPVRQGSGGRRNLPAAVASKPPCRLRSRSEEHTSELQSQSNLVCRLLLEKKNKTCNIVSCEYIRSFALRLCSAS